MEETTALSTIDTAQVAVIVDTAPRAMEINSTSVERANAAGQTLLDTIAASGMSDELDERCNKYLSKVKTTIEEMEGRRKPVTQIFDFIKTQFTTLENALSPKNKDSIYVKIQAARDKYATDKINEQRRLEAEAKRKLELDKELIRLKSDVQTQLANFFNSFLSLRLSLLNELFSGITLQYFDSTKYTIENFESQYPHAHFESFAPSVTHILSTPQQLEAIIVECTKGKYGEFASEFNKNVSEAKSNILDRLPSRKGELEAIAKAEEAARVAALAAKSKAEKEAAAAEAERADQMKLQAEKRQQEEAAKLKADEEKRTADAASKISVEATASYTNSLFEAQEAVATASAPAASLRESFEIEVLNPIGYLLIAQLYFEHEGKSETVAKLEKKTLGSMKGFCEKLAMKSDIKISSPYIKYTEKFKTVAKKS